jgi:hypothetical protein
VDVDVRNPDGEMSPERVALIVDAAPAPEVDRVAYDCNHPATAAVSVAPLGAGRSIRQCSALREQTAGRYGTVTHVLEAAR